MSLISILKSRVNDVNTNNLNLNLKMCTLVSNGSKKLIKCGDFGVVRVFPLD